MAAEVSLAAAEKMLPSGTGSRQCSCSRIGCNSSSDAVEQRPHEYLWGTRLQKTSSSRPRYADDGSDLVGLAAMCDWFCCERQLVRLSARRQPRIVYLSTYAAAVGVPYFVQHVLPLIGRPFVLVLAGDDYSFPSGSGDRRAHVFRACQRECQLLLQHPLIVRVFCEEPDIVMPDRLGVLPIGFHLLQRERRQELARCWQLPHNEVALDDRPILVFNSHRVGGPRQGEQWRNRERVAEFVQQQQPPMWYTPAAGAGGELSLPEFLRQLRRSKFTLCVHGGGQGPSHKCWEALLCGSVPIMQKRFELCDAYRGLPILWLPDWQPATLQQHLQNPAALLQRYRDEFQEQMQPAQRPQLLYRLSSWFQLNRMLMCLWRYQQQQQPVVAIQSPPLLLQKEPPPLLSQQQQQPALRILAVGKGFWGRRVVDMALAAAAAAADSTIATQWTDLDSVDLDDAAAAAAQQQQHHLVVKSHFVLQHSERHMQWYQQQRLPVLCWSGESYLVHTTETPPAFLHIVASSTQHSSRRRTMLQGVATTTTTGYGYHDLTTIQHLPYAVNACFALAGANVVANDLQRPLLLAYCSRNAVELRDRVFLEVRRLDSSGTTHGLGRLHHTPGVASVEGSWSSAELRAAYSGYRFAMAMENEQTEGYVTEKLLVAWMAGCVPVYWGDTAMVQHLFGRAALGALVNVDDFATPEACAQHIVGMSDEQYAAHVRCNPLLRRSSSPAEDDDDVCEWTRIGGGGYNTSYGRLGYHILYNLV